MSSIKIIPDIGGLLIWLWKRIILGKKHVKLDDEINDLSWRVWLVGTIALFLCILFCMIMVGESQKRKFM